MQLNSAAPLHAPERAVGATAALGWTVLVLTALIGMYFYTASSIVAIWNSSETFAHGYVIVPISLWLIWRQRGNFAVYPPRPCWPALALLALLGLAWLVARMGEVQVVMQYAFTAMLPLCALAMLGWPLARSLCFPLLFMLFAVPFGEVLIDPLIQFTADFTVTAVRLSGIPVLRNGTQFELPSGNWSVVEACSGIRYLVSSITLGSLYAYLTYRTPLRRAMFVLLSIVVPIIANGLRAYMIVMLGHFSGMTLAVGVDHLIYGWLFFGLVMLLMFWIGSYWQQGQPPVTATTAADAGTGAAAQRTGLGIAAATVAVAALWPAWAAYNDRASYNPAAPQLALQLPLPAAALYTQWTPRYMAADASLTQTYLADGAPVSVRILYYRNQHNRKALISSTNKLAGEKDAYHVTSTDLRQETVQGTPFAVREARIAGPEGSQLTWYWMRVGAQATASNYGGKAWQAWYKLSGQGDDGATVMLSTPLQGEQPGQQDAARATLRAFLQAQLPAIDMALERARKERP